MIDATHKLPVTRQAELLDLSRSNVYYLPRPVSDADLVLMRRIDERHLNFPFAGARMLRDSIRLGSSSPTNRSLAGSQRILRPTIMAMFPRCATEMLRCATSAGAAVRPRQVVHI